MAFKAPGGRYDFDKPENIQANIGSQIQKLEKMRPPELLEATAALLKAQDPASCQVLSTQHVT